MSTRASASRDAPWKRTQKRLSGYQFFLRVVLQELKKQYPDCSIVLSEVSRLCAEKWQSLQEVIKRRFQDEADAINYTNFGLTNVDKKGKPRVSGIKRPLSPFILYCKENRRNIKKQYPELTMGQISTILSCMWSKVDEQTKLKFQQQSRAQRERYREEVRLFKESWNDIKKEPVDTSLLNEIDMVQIKMEVESEEEFDY